MLLLQPKEPKREAVHTSSYKRRTVYNAVPTLTEKRAWVQPTITIGDTNHARETSTRVAIQARLWMYAKWVNIVHSIVQVATHHRTGLQAFVLSLFSPKAARRCPNEANEEMMPQELYFIRQVPLCG